MLTFWSGFKFTFGVLSACIAIGASIVFGLVISRWLAEWDYKKHGIEKIIGGKKNKC